MKNRKLTAKCDCVRGISCQTIIPVAEGSPSKPGSWTAPPLPVVGKTTRSLGGYVILLVQGAIISRAFMKPWYPMWYGPEKNCVERILRQETSMFFCPPTGSARGPICQIRGPSFMLASDLFSIHLPKKFLKHTQLPLTSAFLMKNKKIQ